MVVRQEHGAVAGSPITWAYISANFGLLVIGFMWADRYIPPQWALLWYGATMLVGLLMLAVLVYGFCQVTMDAKSGTDGEQPGA